MYNVYTLFIVNEYDLYSKYDRQNMSIRVIFQANVYILYVHYYIVNEYVTINELICTLREWITMESRIHVNYSLYNLIVDNGTTYQQMV